MFFFASVSDLVLNVLHLHALVLLDLRTLRGL